MTSMSANSIVGVTSSTTRASDQLRSFQMPQSPLLSILCFATATIFNLLIRLADLLHSWNKRSGSSSRLPEQVGQR